MSMPKDIGAYENEWMELAYILQERGSFILPLKDKKLAAKYRFRFYGFRKALQKHDMGNPIYNVCMESEVLITSEGDLQFTKSPLGAIMRVLLAEAKTTPLPPSGEPSPQSSHASQGQDVSTENVPSDPPNTHEDAILNYLKLKKED